LRASDKTTRFYHKRNYKKGYRRSTKKKNLPALSKIKFEDLHEGLSAQIMAYWPILRRKTNSREIT
jgi:hypothetical protein